MSPPAHRSLTTAAIRLCRRRDSTASAQPREGSGRPGSDRRGLSIASSSPVELKLDRSQVESESSRVMLVTRGDTEQTRPLRAADMYYKYGAPGVFRRLIAQPCADAPQQDRRLVPRRDRVRRCRLQLSSDL